MTVDPATVSRLRRLIALALFGGVWVAIHMNAARAAGIPAREVAGVTAIDRGEGLYYHAWPEVWVGEWIALDPTLGQDAADATHIKFAVGGADQLFRIIALFGKIKAKVVKEAAAH